METSTLEPHPSFADRKATIRDLHDNCWARLLPHNLVSFVWVGLIWAAIASWSTGWWPVTVLVWLLAAHMGHMKMSSFHEASHGTLHPTFFRNEMQGMLIGSVILTPLSVFRLAHWQHHAYLATPRDPELWPFTLATAPRVLRVLAAVAEIVLGFFYTPLLFVRAVLTSPHIPRRQRLRIGLEYAACVATWGTILTVVARHGWWQQLFVGYLIPAFLSASFQTIRKYTEHLGLLGGDTLTVTRTVVPKDLTGTVLSKSMLHIDYHGTHHRYARVPYYNLPEATPLVFTEGEPAIPIYPSYLAAMWDMFKSLGNPKVGPQWTEGYAGRVQKALAAHRAESIGSAQAS